MLTARDPGALAFKKTTQLPDPRKNIRKKKSFQVTGAKKKKTKTENATRQSRQL